MNEIMPNNGGHLVAEVLQRNNIHWIFTLCGGHISPILTACNQKNIKVIDVRHEATAVFAADAVSRLSNNIGVAAVTAGPGLTNVITAITNAHLAQTPLLILGGATATVLKGRGSLQDINQLALVQSNTKLSATIRRVSDIKPTLEKAISIAKSGVPGPVYIEFPVDIIYPESIVREWYGLKSSSSSFPWWVKYYLNWNINYIFKDKKKSYNIFNKEKKGSFNNADISKVSELLSKTYKPILLIGSQAMGNSDIFNNLVKAVKKLNIPTYVSGMARGLLAGSEMPIYRHFRKKALREADGVILAGVPVDFRLDYGRHINHKAAIVSINLSKKDLKRNRKPHKAILADPSRFLISLSQKYKGCEWKDWHRSLMDRDQERKDIILNQSIVKTEFINPLKICTAIDQHTRKGDIIIADGGDFVATASYIVRPRSIDGWLDPGVFGTLGVGAGFILGAQVTHPNSIIWAIYGDGAFGYSLIEFDTFVRHKIPVIAVIGNDAGWTQIERDQVEILKDPVSTTLAQTKYHDAVIALGGIGFSLEHEDDISSVFLQARESAEEGNAVVINVKIGKTDFRKGSISI